MLPRILLLVLLVPFLILKSAKTGVSFPRGAAPTPESATFHTEVDEVQVTFTAEDASHRILEDVTAGDISVLDDGHPARAITSFRQSFDLPLRLVLAVDRSDSMQRGFSAQQHAAAMFLKHLIRPGTDSVLLVDFASQAVFAQPPADRPDLIFANLQTRDAGTLTALYDALFAAILRLNQPDDQHPRRAIVLLSDGEDNLSMHSLPEVFEAASRADIAIYSITAHTRRGQHPGDAVLQQLAEATGGQAFVLSSYTESAVVLAQIEKQLRTEYTVAFRPTGGGCGFHRISIVHHSPHVHIRARDRYYECRSTTHPLWQSSPAPPVN